MNDTQPYDPSENTSPARECCHLDRSKVCRVIAWVIGGLVLACVFALIFGLLVKWLWSLTLAPLFGLPTPTYWQAVGLIIISRLLLGGFGHHKPNHPPPPWHRKTNGCFPGPFGDRQGKTDVASQ
jgi:hypothetical protein